MYTDILFDADDTLLDFQKAQLHSFKKVLEYYGITFSKKVYKSYGHINNQLWKQFELKKMAKDCVQTKRFFIFFNTLSRSIDGNEANIIYQYNLGNQTWLMPHAEDVCKKLSKKYTLTIVTNGVGKTQKKRILSSSVSKYIKHIVISEDIGVAKPDKRFFDYVFKLIGNYPDKILLVGDSLSSDIIGANKANIDAYWYNPDLRCFDINYTIKGQITDLRQLLDVL